MRYFVTIWMLGVSLSYAQDNVLPPVTLKDCYQMAVKQSETIAINDELIRQAEALYKEAKGSSLPEVYFGYDSTWQDKPNTASATPGTFFISPQTNTKIGARKSLFTGYRELAAIKSGSNFVGQRKDEKNRALQLLLNDVAIAFYGTLQSEADLAIIEKDLKLLQDRLKETRQRANIGRSRGADVPALESQVHTLEAQQLESQRLVSAQRDLLSFYTGQSMRRELQPSVVQGGNMETLPSFVNHVVNRPDLQAQEKAVDVSKAIMQSEKSKHLPTLDLSANYYLDRKGFREDVDWDAALVLEFPIWQWGATKNAITAAQSDYRQQQLLARRIQRQAEIDVQTAYNNVMSLRQQNEIYEKAGEAARKEHAQTVKDYRSGLVTTFDVLESMDRLYQTEKALNLTVLNARLAELNLRITAGYQPEEILQ